MVPPILEGFDYANTAAPLGERPVTTVVPQSLMLLNDQFLHEQSAAFARRLMNEASEDSRQQIARAYQLALGRLPTEREASLSLAYLNRQTQSYEQLALRVTFAPDVPLSLHNSYLSRLQPADYLLGPREGWTYYRGRWVGGYEGIMTVDRQRGPFALWQGPTFADGVIEGQMTLQDSVEFGAVLLRATAEGDIFRGYEVVFGPRDQSIMLRRHGADVTVIEEIQTSVPTGKTVPIRIEAVGPRIKVWIGNLAKPVLDVNDPQPLQDAGRLGAQLGCSDPSRRPACDHRRKAHQSRRHCRRGRRTTRDNSADELATLRRPMDARRRHVLRRSIARSKSRLGGRHYWGWRCRGRRATACSRAMGGWCSASLRRPTASMPWMPTISTSRPVPCGWESIRIIGGSWSAYRLSLALAAGITSRVELQGRQFVFSSTAKRRRGSTIRTSRHYLPAMSACAPSTHGWP